MKTFTVFLAVFFLHPIMAQTFLWTAQVSGVTQNLNDVYFANSQTGWTVGVSGIILNTTNGGNTWAGQTSGTGEILRTVFFINSNTGWVGGGSSSGVLLKTTNGGQTWSKLSGINIPNPIIDIAFADASVGWLITSDSIYYSSDGGVSWTAEDYTGVIGTAVNHSLTAVSTTQAFVGGRRFQTGIQDSSPEVYDRRMTSGSYMWGPTTSNEFDLNDRIESIAFSGASYGFAGGINGKLYRMEVAAPVVTGPWEEVLDLGGGNNQTINSIAFPAQNRGMFCTPSQNGPNSYTLIFHTFDTGINWTAPDSIPDFLASKMHAPDTMTAWAVGGNGKIYKGVDPTIGLSEVLAEIDILVFPNPFADILEIRSLEVSLQVKITNQLGQIVFERTTEGSNLIIESDLWPAGIYFVHVQGKGANTIQKVIKL